jgi:hypothetical protein
VAVLSRIEQRHIACIVGSLPVAAPEQGVDLLLLRLTLIGTVPCRFGLLQRIEINV